jgi:hypothetical protein
VCRKDFSPWRACAPAPRDARIVFAAATPTSARIPLRRFVLRLRYRQKLERPARSGPLYRPSYCRVKAFADRPSSLALARRPGRENSSEDQALHAGAAPDRSARVLRTSNHICAPAPRGAPTLTKRGQERTAAGAPNSPTISMLVAGNSSATEPAIPPRTPSRGKLSPGPALCSVGRCAAARTGLTACGHRSGALGAPRSGRRM